jgi:NAD(P)-dependent dehydrogenase (short-subunit alcohol dehydrogenase family)
MCRAMAMRFSGTTALVTGGNRGIGRAIAIALASEGARVAIACRDIAQGELVAQEIVAAGGVAMALRCDVTVPADVEKCTRSIEQSYGVVRVLVNAAGGFESGAAAATEVDEEGWRAVLDVNLGGAWRVSRALLPAMAKAGGGAVIHVASIGGIEALARSAAYVASKSGLVGLTRSMALDYAPHGIRVCCVCPGGIETDMLKRAIQRHESPHKLRLQVTALHPIGRIGVPEDVAPAVLFLASDDARFITGIVLPVDGGYLLRRFPVAPPEL